MKRPICAQEARQLNPVVLAFVGDAVYSLYVRERLVCDCEGTAADFQRTAARVVSAEGQSRFLDELLPLFTEEENDIFRRGRNAKKATKSKHASVADYNRSTGFEAVLGYLYLTGNEARVRELLANSLAEDYEIKETVTAFKPVRR